MLKFKKFRLLALATGLCLPLLVAAEEAEVLSLEEAPPMCVLPKKLMPIYEQEQPDDSAVEGDTAEPDEVVTT